MAESFWNVPKEQMRTPVTILGEQATALTEATQGVLQGRVFQDGAQPGQFVYRVSILVPALNNYTYSILQVTHGIQLYPANVMFAPRNATYNAPDEAQFMAMIKDFLSSAETGRIVAGLMAQVSGQKS